VLRGEWRKRDGVPELLQLLDVVALHASRIALFEIIGAQIRLGFVVTE
jgi:hypothetical protein